METDRHRARMRAEAMRLRAGFERAGALNVETAVLQPASALLDLYGEDIRARAYTVVDAIRGEQMMRPDFTLPVVQMHMAFGAEPARYTYAGEVFRRQDEDPERDNEYFQVGYELFSRADPAMCEAEVFELLHSTLSDMPLRVATGDIGVLDAALEGLALSPARRQALRRHIWRPRRFRRLLERYAGKGSRPNKRRFAEESAVAAPAGLRSAGEIAQRIAWLEADAAEPDLPEGQLDLLDALLGVREKVPYALENLRDLAVDLPSLGPALSRLEQRYEAIAAKGIAVDALDFEASYGRSSMEYYDGFVFGFYAEARPDLPPVATGGRYDALTRHLGGGVEIPAVGGVIRPGVALALKGEIPC